MRKIILRMRVIDIYIKKMGMTVSTFCERCKIDMHDYLKLRCDNYDVPLKTLLKIAEFTGIPPFILLLEY